MGEYYPGLRAKSGKSRKKESTGKERRRENTGKKRRSTGKRAFREKFRHAVRITLSTQNHRVKAQIHDLAGQGVEDS